MSPKGNVRAARCSERQKFGGILDEVVRKVNRKIVRFEGMTRDELLALREWIVERRRHEE